MGELGARAGVTDNDTEATVHDHKGYSEEQCVRCGWVMGRPPLNCNNDDTPHVFPSQLPRHWEGQTVFVPAPSPDPESMVPVSNG